MNLDYHLSKKSYYETLLDEAQKENAVGALGYMLLEENKKELADLSFIRFAQGEVYFHLKDYESAIFKWGNISNDLEAWAKKNVADAYWELELASTAIDGYKAIETDNIVLQTEIALKLFEIYLKEQKNELAVNYIKKAVAIHPDYEKITEVAQLFFEQSKDFDNAIELAVNESIRTEKSYWFDVLIGYAEKNVAAGHDPDYFIEVLRIMFYVDSNRFEKLVVALWSSYEETSFYIKWLQNFNAFLKEVEIEKSQSWETLSRLYNDTFFLMVSGSMELKELARFMPEFLENWTRITSPREAMAAFSATLAWNEVFPSAMEQKWVHEAQQRIKKCSNQISVLEDSIDLFDSLTEWSAGHNIEVNHKFRWFVQEILDLTKQTVLLTGVNETGKSSFINDVLGVDLLLEPTNHPYLIEAADDSSIKVISEEGMYEDTEVEDLVQAVNYDNSLHSKAIMNVKLPAKLLEEHHVALLDTPGLRGRKDKLPVAEFFPIADYALFVIDAEDPFTEQEKEIVIQMREQAPDLPIAFIMTKLDSIYNKQEAKRIVDETFGRILAYVPDAVVIPYSAKYEVDGQRQAVNQLLASVAKHPYLEERRTEKLLQMIQRTIHYLVAKRAEKEEAYAESIRWNQELVKKLEASILQLEDLTDDKAALIKGTYHKIKEEVRAKVELRLPELLKDCGNLLKEDSDFRKIHLVVNDEMNARIQSFFEEEIIPWYYDELETWLMAAKEELTDGKEHLDDMSAAFNSLYGEDKVIFEADFRVLDDWQRDISRMTAGADIERENIFLRNTPSQLLLKGAGKLFNGLSQNKTLLYNQYKKLIENEDYSATTQSVLSKYMLPFDVFEKAINRDMKLFFLQPIKHLKQLIGEAEGNIKAKENLLRIMKEKPEIFQDAITLFEIRLRQYEWVTDTEKEKKYA
ncbi:MAG: dynamin family protein [Bacillus sp. (in: firmicutes)]